MSPRPGMEIRRKPEGGFVLIAVPELLLPWWAQQHRLIDWFSVRVWCALQEMCARRCQIPNGETPHYTAREAAGLVGDATDARVVRAVSRALQQLGDVGLVSFSEDRITFASHIKQLGGIDDTLSYTTMLGKIINHRRKVPVPRRTIRFIAAGAKRSVVGTMLGHLLRCLYYQKQPSQEGECRSWGRVKASWIAEVFGLCLRSVYNARQFLTDHGWLYALQTSQRELNGGGLTAVVSLRWGCAEEHYEETSAADRESAGPCDEKSHAFAGPFLHREPLQEQKDHQPVQHDYIPRAGGGHTQPSYAGENGFSAQPKKSPQPSSLLGGGKITREQLSHTESLLHLFEEAQGKGLANDMLRFFAMAERAKNRGTVNPGGFFYQLVKRHLFHFLTEGEMDTAKQRLTLYFYGRSRGVAAPSIAQVEMSADARFVMEITRRLREQGFRGDPFLAVNERRPEWTAERWTQAVLEAKRFQLRQETMGPREEDKARNAPKNRR